MYPQAPKEYSKQATIDAEYKDNISVVAEGMLPNVVIYSKTTRVHL